MVIQELQICFVIQGVSIPIYVLHVSFIHKVYFALRLKVDGRKSESPNGNKFLVSGY